VRPQDACFFLPGVFNTRRVVMQDFASSYRKYLWSKSMKNTDATEYPLTRTDTAWKRIIVCGILLLTTGAQARSQTVLKADLDHDGSVERIVLNPAQELTLSVWRGNRRLWQGVPKRWKPWKLTIADVDSGGRLEIVVGLYKATRFFPKPHNCLFVYGFNGQTVQKKWLGSGLGRPFTNFTFADTDGDRIQELVALETTRAGKRCVGVYEWNGFGFTLDWERGYWKNARLLEEKNGAVRVDADGRQIIIERRRK
jgi:hypothetical protein